MGSFGFRRRRRQAIIAARAGEARQTGARKRRLLSPRWADARILSF